jgi:hypothetical protein
MAALTAKLFRDYFGGSWSGKVSKNGQFQREIIFNWPQLFGEYSALCSCDRLGASSGDSAQADTRQVVISGWRSDVSRWCSTWHNEFGGSGELQWTSQEEIDGVNVIYGYVHECKQEGDDPTDHSAMCEMYDPDHFKLTLQSFRKGLVEIFSKRIRTAKELNELLDKKAANISSFW